MLDLPGSPGGEYNRRLVADISFHPFHGSSEGGRQPGCDSKLVVAFPPIIIVRSALQLSITNDPDGTSKRGFFLDRTPIAAYIIAHLPHSCRLLLLAR